MDFDYTVFKYVNSGLYKIDSLMNDNSYPKTIRRATLKCVVPEYDWVRVFITEFAGKAIISTNYQVG